MPKNKHGRVGVKKGRKIMPLTDEQSVFYESGWKSGYSTGVTESAGFYKRVIQELRDAKNIRQVRAIFSRLESEGK